MNSKHLFPNITLTTDQQNALEKLQQFFVSDQPIFILKGYAGSGKTTLLEGVVKHLIERQQKYQLMAPTGRAAKVIHRKTKFIASTIHRVIYNFKELHEIKKGDEENDISFLYQFNLRDNLNVNNTVFIVDEASMVSDVSNENNFFRFGSGFLLRDLISYTKIQDQDTTNKIIFIGDPAQLPPVGMNYSPALDLNYLKVKYALNGTEVEMKEVKRQDKNNGILLAATRIRQSLTANSFNDFDLRENQQNIFNPTYQDFLSTYKEQEDKKIIICFQNSTALKLNKDIRIDKFGKDGPIQEKDVVIISANNYNKGVMNGEFAMMIKVNPKVETKTISFNVKGGGVKSVTLTWREVSFVKRGADNKPENISGYILENYLYGDGSLKPEEMRALYIDFKKRHSHLKKGTEPFNQAIKTDPYFNCIMIKYGYAITCHKAQGGEWPNVFIFWDKGVKTGFDFNHDVHDRSGKTNSDFYRWAYTAVTRASDQLFCINPPYFSSFTGMEFVDLEIKKAVDEFMGDVSPAIEIAYSEVLPDLENHGLADASLSIQNHFINCLVHVRKHQIAIAKWERVGYEIRYYFKKEKTSAAFKYWVNGKDVVKEKFVKLPSQTNSEELFTTITKILQEAPAVSVNRDAVKTSNKKFEFESAIEETQPYLKNLFDQISENLASTEVISQVEHLDYKERYTIENSNGRCKIDFGYNGDGFFGLVNPLAKHCDNSQLLAKIKNIVNNLKAIKNVI